MNNMNIYDDEARSRERKILEGKRYLEVFQQLRQRSLTDASCVPTISRMAQELRISEEKAEEIHDYAFNELADDEMGFIDDYSTGLF